MIEDWVELGGAVFVIEEDIGEANLVKRQWDRFWELSEGHYPLRYTTDLHAFPIAAGGQTMVGLAEGTLFPTIFGEGTLLKVPKRTFRYTMITPEDLPEPSYTPGDADTFGDLLQLRGVVADRPQAGAMWEIQVIWKVLRLPDTHYQFSIRLHDDSGNGYGQIDGSTLAPNLWQANDTVLTRFALPVADTLPDDANLNIQVIVYSWPDTHNVPLVDTAGNPIGEILTLLPDHDQ